MAAPKASEDEKQGYLTGQLLIAMPTMGDQRFARSVIYVCAHSSDGAMGLVVNKGLPAVDPAELLDQLGIDESERPESLRIQFGGPVESGRGFVLHTADFEHDGTVVVDRNDEGGVAMTATLDILRAIAKGEGPCRHILTLGYAGWGPGQLDGEIQENGWLNVPADQTILFDEDLSTKWERAIAKLGFSPHMLSIDAGHA
ncbi:MAG: YqgE/AlgH family protein [Pseudomonadota bacterium]